MIERSFGQPLKRGGQSGRLVLREILIEDLDYDDALDCGRGGIGSDVMGAVDRSKPASANLLENPIGTECFGLSVEQ
jgi:hypothetical protein